jgi:hypothetical protein
VGCSEGMFERRFVADEMMRIVDGGGLNGPDHGWPLYFFIHSRQKTVRLADATRPVTSWVE